MKSKLIFTFVLCGFVGGAVAGVEETVEALLPKLSAENVRERYAPQMELQALVAKACRPGAEAERGELARVLAAKAADSAIAQPARVWLVRQLEYLGAAESVAALRELLAGSDAELRECARRALEKNSAPEATEILRATLARGGEAAWQIGLMHSLGERRDPEAVSLIARNLKDPALSLAAASALAQIATGPAVEALWAAREKGAAMAADALIAAAGRLMAEGQARKASEIYSRLYSSLGPAQTRAAALVGLGKADPEQAKPLLAQALADADPRLQTAAVTSALRIYGDQASKVLVELWPKLGPRAKCQVVRALDSAAEKQILTAAADDPDEPVRVAALERLGQIGTSASIPVLARLAVQDEQAGTQKAARRALTSISGQGTDAALAQLAATGDSRMRVIAIGALAERNDQGCRPSLLKYAAESDHDVSAAACTALGKIGTDKELEPLVQLVLAGRTPGADSALQSVASRAQDKSAASARVVSLARTAQPQQLPGLFDILAMLGGKEALTAVTQFASGPAGESGDAAVRALANWPDFSAAQPLLEIASAPNCSRVRNVLAIQGISRLVSASEKEPAGARVDMAVSGLKAAARNEEKKLLLAALGSIRNPRAAEALKPFLQDPELRAEAGLAAVSLAQGLFRSDRRAAKDLAQAIKDANVSADLTRKAEGVLER